MITSLIHRLRGRRHVIPYLFELTVIVALIAIVYIAVRFQGERLQRIWRHLATPILFTPAPQVYGGAINLARSEDGTVWVLTKYSVLRFSATEEPHARILLNGISFRESLGHGMNSLSAFQPICTDEAWVGSSLGELLHYRDGSWHQHSFPGGVIDGRIQAVAAAVDEVFVGGSFGLWRWSVLRQTLAPVPGAPSGDISALALDKDGTLLVAVGNTLWRHSGPDWISLWTGVQARSINVIARGSNNQWLLGTDNGLAVLGSAGEELDRRAPTLDITAIVEHEGVLWMGTRNNGLFALVDEKPLKINLSNDSPVSSVTGLSVDTRQRLWLSVYDRGAFYSSLPKLTALLGLSPPAAAAEATASAVHKRRLTIDTECGRYPQKATAEGRKAPCV